MTRTYSDVLGPQESKYFASDKVALLIANERYNHHNPLPAAPSDVEELTQILQVCSFV